MNKKQKKVFTRIIVAAVLMVVLSLLPIDGWLKFVLFMIPYLVMAFLYIVIVATIAFFIKLTERRLARNERN